jgi:exosome complex RNA-binding protein Rrp42 (RNase PH superfamily)
MGTGPLHIHRSSDELLLQELTAFDVVMPLSEQVVVDPWYKEEQTLNGRVTLIHNQV